MKTKQFILMFAAAFLFLSTNPQNAYSQWVDTNRWDDNSDEIQDGFVDLTGVLIAGGVLLTGTIVYLIVKKNKDKKSSSFSHGGEAGLLARSSTATEGSFYDRMNDASQNSPVEIFTGKPSSGSQKDYEPHSGLSVGLRFKF